jgi:hypothetical protein
MFMGWFEWFERLRAEWPAATAARWAIVIGISFGLFAGFSFSTLWWSGTVSALRERINLYQDRLQGASPDEAAKQIAELKTQVATLIAESQNQWKFTAKEQKALAVAIEKEPKKIGFKIIPVPASPVADARSRHCQLSFQYSRRA